MKQIGKNYNNENLIFIRGFSDITITKICKKLKICRSNLIMGQYVDEAKYKLVRREIEKEIAKLYLK